MPPRSGRRAEDEQEQKGGERETPSSHHIHRCGFLQANRWILRRVARVALPGACEWGREDKYSPQVKVNLAETALLPLQRSVAGRYASHFALRLRCAIRLVAPPFRPGIERLVYRAHFTHGISAQPLDEAGGKRFLARGYVGMRVQHGRFLGEGRHVSEVRFGKLPWAFVGGWCTLWGLIHQKVRA